MSRLASKEIYTVPIWMRRYLPLFNNTGGNDVEELLHDDSTTPFANVVRYLLIVSIRSQFDLLMILHKNELLDELDGNRLAEVYRSAYEEARHDGLVNWEAATSLVEENEDLKCQLEAAENRISELEAMADNAHEALSAVLDSGDVTNQHAINMLMRGLNNQPQRATGIGLNEERDGF